MERRGPREDNTLGKEVIDLTFPVLGRRIEKKRKGEGRRKGKGRGKGERKERKERKKAPV